MNIETLYDQAALAQAAYAETLVSGPPDIDALKEADMTQTQAEAFAEQYRVIDQYTAPSMLGLTGSGFSATVFQNKETGQYVFAIRGTQPSQMNDLLDADISHIGFDGLALPQALDLYNYLKSLETTAGQAYLAAYLQTDVAETTTLNMLKINPLAYTAYQELLKSQGYLVDGSTVRRLALGLSTEVLEGTGLETGRREGTVQLSGKYDVVGHSLGGHLAMILGRLDAGNVASVETFNPPYFDVFGQYTEQFFSQLQQLEIDAYGISGVSNIFKDSQNYEVPNDLIHLLGSIRPGTAHAVFSEGDNPLTSHNSVVGIADALAVYSLFAYFDTSLNNETFRLFVISSGFRGSKRSCGIF